MASICIKELDSLCQYGTDIVVKRADTGRVVIDGVRLLANSHDKRQKAKWEAFKDKEVYGIRPSLRTEGIKRDDTFFRMTIVVWISSGECEKAIEEYKMRVNYKEPSLEEIIQEEKIRNCF